MKFRGAVSILLLCAFLYFAFAAGWWNVIRAWDLQTRAVVAFLVVMTWSIADDFGGGGHGG